MRTLRLILGDQLSASISSLRDAKPEDVILLCEVMAEATYVNHHPKKIAFLFSAMRHFAEDLKQAGFHVEYTRLDDPQNSGSFSGEVARAVKAFACAELIVTEPGEWRVLQMMQSWQAKMGIPVEIRADERFFCTISDFKNWAKDKKQLRMEYFYREQRRKNRILLTPDGDPIGGQWNYDKENRKPPSKQVIIPNRLPCRHDSITRDVLMMVDKWFKNHYGRLEPFEFAVTREDAQRELDHFITEYLPLFGDYQDAMAVGEPFLYHSRISAYLNAGLLLPAETCAAAEQAYYDGKAPLNAVEGFIRQILGWREYVRGIYWAYMPDYAARNDLGAVEPLPEFYWTAETQMNCMREAITHTLEHAYSHHIQRLMVTGNFALLAGLDVKEVQEWYLAVYADAYEWVEMPNTLGMALFGDGGLMASKPYAASGKYIRKMSNYCQSCVYKVEETTGESACPFNALYWDFMARHRQKLKSNQRMPYVYSTWDKFATKRQNAIRSRANEVITLMRQGKL